MKQLLSLLLLVPMWLVAQEENKGIRFEEGLTWEQVKAKARKENKMIFVDCYATWCQPCKVMDQKVYPNDTIGAFMNERFISVKMQMDSTKKDNEGVRLLYPAARNFEKNYSIAALPTYLFFATNGEAVHKDMGALDVKEFMQLVKFSTDPEQQVYTQVKRAQQGKMSAQDMATLALKLRNEYKDKTNAELVAIAYKTQYLEKQSIPILLSKEHLKFIASLASIVKIDDKIFDLYYLHAAEVDSSIGLKGHAKSMIDYVISKEMLDPYLVAADKKGKQPNWKKLGGKIKAKFGDALSEKNITNAKVRWYTQKKDNINYVKYLVEQIDRYREASSFKGDLALFSLNNYAWKVFLYSNDKIELEKALIWADHAIQEFRDNEGKAAAMDTKANILYKLDRKSEALTLQTQAIQSSKDQAFIKAAEAALVKMKKGEATWQ